MRVGSPASLLHNADFSTPLEDGKPGLLSSWLVRRRAPIRTFHSFGSRARRFRRPQPIMSRGGQHGCGPLSSPPQSVGAGERRLAAVRAWRGKRFFRGRSLSLAFQRLRHRSGTRARNGPSRFALPFGRILGRFATRARRHRALFRWRQFHSGPARFGKADGDGLFGIAGAMFAGPDFIYFLTDEFAGLSRWGFALPLGGGGTFEGGFFRHIFSSRGHAELDLQDAPYHSPTGTSPTTIERDSGRPSPPNPE